MKRIRTPFKISMSIAFKMQRHKRESGMQRTRQEPVHSMLLLTIRKGILN